MLQLGKNATIAESLCTELEESHVVTKAMLYRTMASSFVSLLVKKLVCTMKTKAKCHKHAVMKNSSSTCTMSVSLSLLFVFSCTQLSELFLLAIYSITASTNDSMEAVSML